MPVTVITHSREETQQIAADIAARLQELPHDRAVVVTLRGELGAGKTTFTQGLLAALGVTDTVASPTFILMQRYPLTGSFDNAQHLDAYRLTNASSLDTLGLPEILRNPRNLVIVEWPEIGGSLFQPHLDIALEHGSTEHERSITTTWLS